MTIASSNHVTEEMTVDVLADAIRKLNVRKQAPEKLDDVLDLIEYLRDQAITLYEHNAKAADELHEREVHLTKREAELAIKSRAVMSIVNSNPQPKRKLLWR